MRLKLFHAPDVSEGLALIRDELGPDALILSTRVTLSGVEITAALEPDDRASPDPGDAPGPEAAPRPALAGPSGAELAERARCLAFHGVPPPLASLLCVGELDTALAATLRFAPLPLGPGAAPLLLVGPPGAGKTLTTARLATRLVLGGQRPLVITADAERAGAIEQLAAFTRLLGIDLVVAHRPETLLRALARRGPGPALIDGPGLDPFDPAGRDELLALAEAAGAEPALVLPAGLDPAEAQDLAAVHAGLGARSLVATRLDRARRLGGVLAAAEAGRLALCEAGVGPGAADGLLALTPALLAAELTRTRQPGHPAPGRSPPGAGPDAPDPGIPDPGLPAPGIPDLGAPDVGAPDVGAPDPGSFHPGTPYLGASGPGASDPGASDPGASDWQRMPVPAHALTPTRPSGARSAP